MAGPVVQESSDPGLVDACGESDRSYVCEQVWEWTDNEFLATAAEWVLDRPVRILLIVVLAWLVSKRNGAESSRPVPISQTASSSTACSQIW